MLFLSAWSNTVLAVLAAICVVVLVLTVLDLRPTRPRWRAVLLFTLRSLGLGLAFLFLLEPALELRDVEREKNRILVLLDGSLSMQVPTPSGASRGALAAEAAAALSAALDEEPEQLLELVLFADEAKPISSAEIEQAMELEEVGSETGSLSRAQRDGTRMREALEQSVARIGREKLGGVVFIGDGADNGILGGRNPTGAVLDEDTRRMLERLEVPVHSLRVAPSGGLRDLSIASVAHDDFAFLRHRVSIELELRALGLANTAVQVELWENGTRLRTQQLAFGSDDERQSLSFDLVPTALGRSVYSLVVPAVEDEALLENNAHHFVMNVIRDKIRVLHVCGQPSWDQKFLRALLKENPNVDLISFYILRTNRNLSVGSDADMSLIPFPKRELFEEELNSFDLIIFQNFDWAEYIFRSYLENIADFVQK
ncbi:MAG: hypothetical protein RBU37_27490, partial [Myxococcota bacterium]|nr:hypothetical protein [Myxococcota bacterium]